MPHTSRTALTLGLKRHCIETAIRKRYERSVSAYFHSPTGRAPIEAEIDLLVRALETLDFPALRARHPALAGNGDHDVRLSLDDEGRLEIRIDGHPIRALPQR